MTSPSHAVAALFAYAEIEPERWEVWNRETKIKHIHHGTREHVEAQLEKMAARWAAVGRDSTKLSRHEWQAKNHAVAVARRREALAKAREARAAKRYGLPPKSALPKTKTTPPPKPAPSPSPLADLAGRLAAKYPETAETTMARSSPTKDAVEAAFKKLSADGTVPTALAVAKEAGMQGDDDAIAHRVHVALAGLRKLGRLPPAPPVHERAKRAAAARVAKLPAPKRPRRPKTTRRASPKESPLDGMIAELREKRAAAVASITRLDRAIAALVAAREIAA